MRFFAAAALFATLGLGTVDVKADVPVPKPANPEGGCGSCTAGAQDNAASFGALALYFLAAAAGGRVRSRRSD